jgi:hypothetical protein
MTKKNLTITNEVLSEREKIGSTLKITRRSQAYGSCQDSRPIMTLPRSWTPRPDVSREKYMIQSQQAH